MFIPRFFNSMLVGACSVLLLLSGCSTPTRRAGTAAPVAGTPQAGQFEVVGGAPEKGLASWYGAAYRGKPTASGVLFNPEALTAAHRTLPFGTYVQVKNLTNGRTVIVAINDRGPFIAGRVIDLSERAAREIGMIKQGLVPVEVRRLRLKRR